MLHLRPDQPEADPEASRRVPAGMPAESFTAQSLHRAQSRGVFVLGMHRSGTSATARALNLLGLPLSRPSDLLPTRVGNLRGYWESQSLIACNERLLNACGSSWWCPPARTELLASLAGMQADAETLASARAAFHAAYLSPQWAWKDPRLCLLLPFWEKVLGIPAVAFLALRSPHEIASSLQRRDGLAFNAGLSLWERYIRQVLLNLRGSPVFVYQYSDLIGDPGGWCEQARSFTRRHGFADVPGGTEDVMNFIDGQLRHERDDAAESRFLNAEQLSLYQYCGELEGIHDEFNPEINEVDSSATTTELDRQRRRWRYVRAAAKAG